MIPDQHQDPFLQAGIYRCYCGGEAYPADAAWVTEDLVLVTFTQNHRSECRELRTWTALIDTGDELGTTPRPPTGNGRRARDYYRQHSCRACGVLTAARYCDAHRCQAQTASARRCPNPAGADGLCGTHRRPGSVIAASAV